MGGEEKTKKISAASARAHTRKSNPKSFSLGVYGKILVVVIVACLAWADKALRPPPPKVLGSPGGPPITAPRIKLRDGRHLAYKEYGVPNEKAKHKFIFIHGFDSCRLHAFIATELSPDTIETLGLYIVGFDRPGYGESDPDPNRTPKSLALDVEELADQLGLGPKFYVVGYSMGGEAVWGLLKYIPHRLAGASLVTPVVNYWWSNLPTQLTNDAYHYKQLPQDKWSLRVAHYAPWLTYWWQTQKLFPPSSVIEHSREILSRQDKELMPRFENPANAVSVRQQGVHECIHRDMIVGFGKWEFDPIELENPFPNNEGIVHLWQGDEDMLVPVTLQRYIAQQLPWIQYHELPGAGHLFPYAKGMSDAIVKAQLSIEI
ncbi:uncharacterized protein LOC104898376 [Beta vulgaris subsp. vulgaris]|uniref:uncharacterized protein LOC104898376 n=1 Tax=Beta vulgaris subsp. vulgaris TaxID=3555 RepID=UPI0020374911|nr:uncharacterized protein LOC104898376 [Beta vulgaris subsp. vulgaris]